LPLATSPNKPGARIGKALRVDEVIKDRRTPWIEIWGIRVARLRTSNAGMMIHGAGAATHYGTPSKVDRLG
jgi:hypothetical protein